VTGSIVWCSYFQLGGYGLPFFVMGSVVIACGTITYYIMPPISGELLCHCIANNNSQA